MYSCWAYWNEDEDAECCFTFEEVRLQLGNPRLPSLEQLWYISKYSENQGLRLLGVVLRRKKYSSKLGSSFLSG
jgi:hypothetical protein